MNGVTIELTSEETKWAMNEGKRAAKECVGFKKYNVLDPLTAHRIGAAGEIAVNKYLGLKWRGFDLNRRHEPDATLCEVRCATRQTHRLLFNDRDWEKRHRKFVLAITLGNRRILLKGWAFGFEGMIDEYLFEREQFIEKIWALPNHKLHPMDELKKETI